MIRNERLKLLATTLNALTLAFIIGGAIAPLLAGQGRLLLVAWFGLGIGLHLAAQ